MFSEKIAFLNLQNKNLFIVKIGDKNEKEIYAFYNNIHNSTNKTISAEFGQCGAD
jgi:hypothetical protein